MSLLREDMLVNGHVYSTGTGLARGGNAPERACPAGQLPAWRLAQVITPCAMVDAAQSRAWPDRIGNRRPGRRSGRQELT